MAHDAGFVEELRGGAERQNPALAALEAQERTEKRAEMLWRAKLAAVTGLAGRADLFERDGDLLAGALAAVAGEVAEELVARHLKPEQS